MAPDGDGGGRSTSEAELAAKAEASTAVAAANAASLRFGRRGIVAAASAAFFFRFLALGAFLPYVFLWLEQAGHSTIRMTFIVSANRAVSFFAPFLWGAVGDLTKRHSLVFSIGAVLNAALAVLMTLHPQDFYWQLLILSAAGLTDSGALLDAMVVRCLAWSGAAEAAPKTRAFGALSWCFAAPICGAISQRFGIRALFFGYAPLLLCPVAVVHTMPVRRAYGGQSSGQNSADHRTSTEGDDARPEPPAAPFFSRVRGVCSGRMLLYFTLMALIGAQMAAIFAFGFIYVQEELHASGLQLGFTLTAQAAIEVPLFQVSGLLVKALGVRTSLFTCLLVSAIRSAELQMPPGSRAPRRPTPHPTPLRTLSHARFAGYAAATSVWAVYPVEFGHGWAFCLYYTCANIIAEEYSSIGLQATVLGMTSSSLQLGQLLATMGMGVLVDRVGMRSSFAICAAVLGVGASPLLVELPACALWTAGCVARVPATGAALARRLARGSARLAARLSGRSRDRAPLRPAGLPSSTDMTSDVGGIGMDIPVVPLPEDRAAD